MVDDPRPASRSRSGSRRSARNRAVPAARRPVRCAGARRRPGHPGREQRQLPGLGPGAVLRFGDVRIEVAAILPDELVGAHELMVSRDVGGSIGVTQDRYALVVPDHARTATAVERLLDPILPADPPSRSRPRRHAVLPAGRRGAAAGPDQAAVRRVPGAPRTRQPFLDLDPAWVKQNIDTQHVPLLGTVTCNVSLFPAARRRPRADRPGTAGHDPFVLGLLLAAPPQPDPERRPVAPLLGHRGRSERAAGNLFGRSPQDARLVDVFERWGFVWGGTFIVPDGCTSSTGANQPTPSPAGLEVREGGEHAQSALCSVSGGRNHRARACLPRQTRGFLLLRGRQRRRGHRTPGLLDARTRSGATPPWSGDRKAANER